MAGYFNQDNGHLGKTPTARTQDVMLIDGKYYKIQKFVALTFSVGDVEDPDIYAAEPIINWQQSDEGKFVMEHAIETPSWHRYIDYHSYGTRYNVLASLKDIDYTFWALKWGTK